MSKDFGIFLLTNSIFLFILIIALFLLLLIVISRNPINVVLYLIGYFFDVAFLLIYCGADYLGILILLLYAGAISIVLLFVIMLLDMKDLVLQKEKIVRFFQFLFFLFVIFLIMKGIFIYYSAVSSFRPRATFTDWYTLYFEKTNIEWIGLVLYEYYIFQFLVIGFFLFLIMILIISLIVNHNLLTKRQNLVEQLKKKNPIIFKD